MPSDAFFHNKNVENSICERLNILKITEKANRSVPSWARMHGEKDNHFIYVYFNSGYSKNVGLHEARVTYSSMFLYLSRFRAE